MRTYSFLWIGVIALTLGLTSMALTAWGGTYNFYFNNTEQGANSTANPAVTVTDGKVVKTEGAQPAPVPTALPAAAALEESAAAAAASGEAAAAAVTSPAASATTAVPAAASAEVQPNQSLVQVSDLEERQERRSYSARFTTSGVLVAQHTTKIYDYGSSSYYGPYTNSGYYHQRYGGAVGMGVYLGRRLAVNAFAGGYEDGGKMLGFAGGDLEFIPLTLSIGKFDRLIEGGLLIGASTLRHAAGNPVSAHAGARVSFNFGDIGLTGVGRINQGVLVAEAGLSFRL